MTLAERIHAAEVCLVHGCDRHRAPDAEVCEDDLNRLWRNQLDRQDDGTYRRRRSFAAHDLTGEIRTVAA